MSRLMSCSMTTKAVIERRKTVTRRKGWLFLKPGDRLTLVEKAMGLKKGEKAIRLAEVEVVDIRREPLTDLLYNLDYGLAEVAREGFPDLSPTQFIYRYFIDAQSIGVDDLVTRIEWKYLDAAVCPDCRDGKHRNCNGDAWSDAVDSLVPCECTEGH